MRRIFLLCVAILLSACGGGSGGSGGSGGGDTPPILGVGTADIDGILSPGEWDAADTYSFDVNLPEGGTTPGTLLIMNDANNLYIALSFARTGLDPGNSLGVKFDNDESGTVSDSDDSFVVNPSIADSYTDNFRVLGPHGACPAGVLCGLSDVGDGGTNDGTALLSNDGFTNVYEVSKPLNSDDDSHDFSLEAGNVIGFQVSLRIIGSGGCCTDTSFPFPIFSEFVQVVDADD